MNDKIIERLAKTFKQDFELVQDDMGALGQPPWAAIVSSYSSFIVHNFLSYSDRLM